MIDNSNNSDILNPLIGKADFLCQTSPLVCEERHSVNPINRRTRAFLLEGEMTKEERIRYHKKNPWAKHLVGILNRCGKVRSYLKIKNLLHTKDLKYLWLRDKAYLMEKPSIHRLDSFSHYTLDNCKFIELSEHWTHPKNRFK